MRRMSGLKDSLGGLFKSKKKRTKQPTVPTSSDASQPALRPLPSRYTELFGRVPTAPNISGYTGETSQHVAQTTDTDLVQAATTPAGDAEDQDLYAAAYREFETREPELAADFAKHLNTLFGDKVDEDLSSIASVEHLVGRLLADREKKQWRIPLSSEKDIKIRAQVEKLTKFLLWSDQVVKQAFSAQPYAGLAWSGVSILLPLIVSGNIQHAAMLDGFEYISHVQMYWRIYEESNIMPYHADILATLTTLYSHITEYQARVICHLSSAQLTRSWQKLGDANAWEGKRKKIADLDSHCRRLVSEVEKVKIQRQQDLQLREMQESQTILANIRQGLKDLQHHTQLLYDDEKECDLLRDLATDYEYYKNINPLRVEGTCEWFFSDDGFRKWREQSTSSLLWASACPGIGKSVLSRALIDEGRLSTAITTSTVCYFFFQDGIDGQMDVCSALSAILHQLFTQDSTGNLIKHGLTSHKNHGEKLKHNFSELWRILLACANTPEAGEIICVFDALDECATESRAQLLNALNSFYFVGWQRTRLKFLITSRPYDDIEAEFKNFPKFPGHIRVDGDDKSDSIGQEINVVIDAKVQEFAGDFTEDHQQRLAERLKGMENRTYLWLHLTFDIIKKRRSAFSKLSRIEDLLDSLPSQVSEAYETILNYNTDEPQDRATTQALFQIILAATRPLSLEEANYALTMASSKYRHASHGSIEEDLWPSANFKTVVKNLSGLFITVCDSKLSFIHLTAREFLTDTKNRGEWHGQFPIHDSHATMSSVCIYYLLTIDGSSFTGDVTSMAQKYPFIPYSARNWSAHYNSEPEERRQAQCKDARKLCDMSGERGKQLSTMLFQTEFEWTSDECENSTDLILASGLGLGPVASLILDERNSQTDVGFEDYEMAVGAASGTGGVEVIRILLQRVKSIKERLMETNAVFGMALGTGHADSIRALRDCGVEICNLSEEDMEEAVTMPMLLWGKDMTIALLEMLGDQFPITDDVIEAAARCANHGAEVMDVLLDRRGAEISMRESVLKAAASNRYFATEVMALLLRRRGDEIEITEEVVIEAAKNYDSGEGLVALLLKERGDRIVVTEKVLNSAACQNSKVMALFLENVATSEAYLTEETVAIAAQNMRDGEEMIKTVLERRDITITEKALIEAAGNVIYGKEVMALLLEAGKGNVRITEGVTLAAAENDRCGREILEYLFDTRGGDVPITDKVLLAAGKNKESEEMMALLSRNGDTTTLGI